MTSSSANHSGPASTTASSPSAKKPTAKCAIGEIRMTTAAGGAEADGELTLPSSHRTVRCLAQQVTNLTTPAVPGI